MVSLSSFAKLGAAARNAMTSREAQTIAKNLETINLAIQKLTATAQKYTGGLLAANSISSDEASLSQDIKNATGDAKKDPEVSEDEAKEVIAYVLSTIDPSIAAAMAAIKEKKTELAAAGLQGTVQGDLVDLRKDTATLGEALIEKAPASLKAEGNAAVAKLDAHFEEAIKFFA